MPQTQIWNIFSDTPDLNLGQHLVAMYWRGKFSLASGESLIERYFDVADEKTRGDVLNFVGRSLRQSDGEIPLEIIARLKDLWEFRFLAASKANFDGYGDELGAFGEWFISGKFDNDWKLETLSRVLASRAEIDSAYFVLKELSELAELYPEPVVNCLASYMETGRGRNRTDGASMEIRSSLDSILRSKKSKAVKKAEMLIDNLLSRGFFYYRDLLDEHFS